MVVIIDDKLEIIKRLHLVAVYEQIALQVNFSARGGNRPRLSSDQSDSVWAPAHGSACLPRTLRRSHLTPCRNDAPLGLHLAVLMDHCARGGNRTHTALRQQNFKSCAFTNFATRAGVTLVAFAKATANRGRPRRESNSRIALLQRAELPLFYVATT